jgi:hypothetical protein
VRRWEIVERCYRGDIGYLVYSSLDLMNYVIYKIKNESRNTGDGLTIFLIPDSSRLYPFLVSKNTAEMPLF